VPVVLLALTLLVSQQQPAFRGGVEFVTVDVRVVGADGQSTPSKTRETC
jgi:hypothetical protein